MSERTKANGPVPKGSEAVARRGIEIGASQRLSRMRSSTSMWLGSDGAMYSVMAVFSIWISSWQKAKSRRPLKGLRRIGLGPQEKYLPSG